MRGVIRSSLRRAPTLATIAVLVGIGLVGCSGTFRTVPSIGRAGRVVFSFSTSGVDGTTEFDICHLRVDERRDSKWTTVWAVARHCRSFLGGGPIAKIAYGDTEDVSVVTPPSPLIRGRRYSVVAVAPGGYAGVTEFRLDGQGRVIELPPRRPGDPID
jgi:hypothetical protein